MRLALRSRLLYIFLLLILSTALFSNPFARGGVGSGSAKKNEQKRVEAVSKKEGFFSKVKQSFISAQRSLNSYLSKKMESFKNSFGLLNLLIISAVSLLYGALHSLGPGHGKALVASYFVENHSASKKDVFKVIVISSIAHNLSALVIGFLMAFALGFGNQENQAVVRSYALFATGVIAIVFGVYLIVKRILKKEDKKEESIKPEKNYGLFTLGVISGIVPCPLSIAVVFFGFYIKSYAVVILSVVFMSLGMAITQGLFGFASLGVSSYAVKKASKSKKIYLYLTSALTYAGAFGIVLVGVFTLLSSFA